MKRIVLIALSLLVYQFINAQSVGIGTTNPNGKSILELSSTTQGLLPPRMTTLQRNSISPTSSDYGMVVYDTNFNEFYYWDGTGWKTMGGADSDWLTNGTHIYNGNSGNVGIGINNPLSKFHVLGTANTSVDPTTWTPTAIFDLPNGSSQMPIEFRINGIRKGHIRADIFDNLVLNGNNAGAVYLGMDAGNGGVIFGNGAGTEVVRVTSSGNVGIGTSNPVANLDIFDDKESFTGIRVFNNSNTVDAKHMGIMFTTGTTASTTQMGTITYNNFLEDLEIDNNGNGDLVLDTDGDDVVLDAADDIRFRLSGTSHSIFKEQGGGIVYFGINNTTPSAPMHVNGEIIVGNSGLTCSATTVGAMRYNSGNIEYCDGSAWTTMGGTDSDWTENATTVSNSTKKIGVGTAAVSAAFQMEIENDISQGALLIDNRYSGAAQTFGVTSQISNLSSGPKYGFNTVVLGNVAQTSDIIGLFTQVRTRNTEAGYGIYNDFSGSSGSGSKYGVYSIGEDYNYFSGNVGIGQNAPNEELVIGTNFNTGWAIPAATIGDATAGGAIEVGSYGGSVATTHTLAIESGATFGRARITATNGGAIGSGNIEIMANGVGIGVNPNARLTVGGVMSMIETGAVIGPTAGYGKYYVSLGDNHPHFMASDGTDYDLTAGGTDNLGNHTATANIQLSGNYLSNDGDNEGITVDNVGRVGVNNPSPLYMFEVGVNPTTAINFRVNGTGYFRTNLAFNSPAALTLVNTNSSSTGVSLDLTSTFGASTATRGRVTGLSSGTNEGSLAFTTKTGAGWSEKMRIDHLGNVGIGLTNATSSLEVNGDIAQSREQHKFVRDEIGTSDLVSFCYGSILAGGVDNSATARTNNYELISNGNGHFTINYTGIRAFSGNEVMVQVSVSPAVNPPNDLSEFCIINYAVDGTNIEVYIRDLSNNPQDDVAWSFALYGAQ